MGEKQQKEGNKRKVHVIHVIKVCESKQKVERCRGEVCAVTERKWGKENLDSGGQET